MLLFISFTLFLILWISTSIFSLSLMFLYFAFIALVSAFCFLASASLFLFASSFSFVFGAVTVAGTVSPSSVTEFKSSCFLASFSSAAFFCFAIFKSLSIFGSVFSAIDTCPIANASNAIPIIFLAFISSSFRVSFFYSMVFLVFFSYFFFVFAGFSAFCCFTLAGFFLPNTSLYPSSSFSSLATLLTTLS